MKTRQALFGVPTPAGVAPCFWKVSLFRGTILGLAFIMSGPTRLAGAGRRGRTLAAEITRASVVYQPLMWVGDIPPTDAENRTLDTEVENMKQRGVAPSIPALEQFIGSYPNSPWTASLRANLGRYYYEHGLYTKALQSWELAWTATRAARSGPAKEIADFAFANWTHLLSTLGRTDRLQALFNETEGRVFDGGQLQQLVDEAKEGYRTMGADPGICFKCGTFALNNVAVALKGRDFDSAKILNIPSPATGFTMTRLNELARQNGLDLVPAQWSDDKTLVVPSIVHWKENHYVALLDQKKGYYLAADPTFGSSRWLSGADIREESSGYFMVPKDRLPKSWRLLAVSDTDKIFGRGIHHRNLRIPVTAAVMVAAVGAVVAVVAAAAAVAAAVAVAVVAAEVGGVALFGAGVQVAANAAGAAVWVVFWAAVAAAPVAAVPVVPTQAAPFLVCPSGKYPEPYINVWLYDQPLGYQPGIGGAISFKITYKQRESRTISPSFFGFGNMWDCSWLSYVEDDGVGLAARHAGSPRRAEDLYAG